MTTRTENTQNSENDLKARTAARVSEEFRKNPKKKSGGEVEDSIQHEDTLEGSGREEARENFENILEDPEVDAEEKTVDNGEEDVLSGVTLKNSPLVDDTEQGEDDPFHPDVDTDFSPHQGEVASAVVDNPGDLVFGVDRPRRVRDRNLPEGYSSFEYALKPEMMFPDWEGPHDRQKFVRGEPEAGKENRMDDPRYLGFVLNDGEVFHAMGAPTATQLNTGTPVGQGMTANQFFFRAFNGGKYLSLPEISKGLGTLFDADALFSGSRENGYEIEVESGREMIYDLFVAESDAVSRKEADERWGDVLDEALPTNENYGVIEDFKQLSEEEAVGDYVDVVMDRPAKLAPELNPRHIRFDDLEDLPFDLDEEDEPVSLETLQMKDEEREWEKQWAVFDQDRQEMDLETLEEEQSYKGKILLDGELVDVTVDHSGMSDEEFDELMDTYFDVQNTMVRPDVAPKTDGIVESRNFSHSDRTYHALLTQKAMVDRFQELQELFYEAGMASDNSVEDVDPADMRERFVRDGLDAELPDYSPAEVEGKDFYAPEDEKQPGTMREFYRFEVLPVLEEGLREAFTEETPYVVRKMAANEDYDDFEEDVLSEFDNMDEFLEYQDLTEMENTSHGDLSEETEAFADWFVGTAYREEMEHWLDPDTPTVNEELRNYANSQSPEEAIKRKKRASHHSYEA